MAPHTKNRPLPKRPWSTTSPWFLWSWELLSLLGCTTALAGIIALLAHNNGRSPFEWNGITLNAMISILSVALKVLMAFAVAECVGQWKWILFSQTDRSLMDFERIDLASRGPLGSVSLVWRKETPSILRLGVAIVILSLAIDPFSQQLLRIKQEMRYLPSSEGTPYAHKNYSNRALATRGQAYSSGRIICKSFDKNGSEVAFSKDILPRCFAEMEPTMEAAVANGLSGINSQFTAKCPTANCTWPAFETIGVCHRCNDLKAELKKVDDFLDVILGMSQYPNLVDKKMGASAWTLPNGHFMPNRNMGGLRPNYVVYTQEQMYSLTSYGTGDPGNTVSMKDLDALIWSMSVIQIDPDPTVNWTAVGDWPDMPMAATECSLYYCVKKIEAAVTWNVLNETSTEVNEAELTFKFFEPQPDRFYTLGRYGKQTDLRRTPNGKPLLEWNETAAANWDRNISFLFPGNASTPIYGVGRETIGSLGSHFQNILRAEIPHFNNSRSAIEEKLGKNAVGFNGYVGLGENGARGFDPTWLQRLVPSSQNKMREVFEHLALAITNEMRGMYASTSSAEGQVGAVTTLYVVNWSWITLHCVILVGGTVFCVLTILASRLGPYWRHAAPVWKSNSLAALKQGSMAVDALANAWTVGEMKMTAEERRTTVVPPEEEIPLPRADEDTELSAAHNSTLELMPT